MADVIVRGTATRWESDEAGSIEVVVVDAVGRAHHVGEKVLVLTTTHVTHASVFPAELWLDATCRRLDGARVIVALKAGVETTEGLGELTVAAEAVP